MSNPYKIAYELVGKSGVREACIHARSHDEARYFFYSGGMHGVKMISCELDVDEAEFETAALVAFRHRSDPDAKKVIAGILKKCRIDRRKVRHRVAKLGLPI